MIILNALIAFTATSTSTCPRVQGDYSKHIDYTTVAVPMAQALADLSRLSGLTMKASASMAAEPIILRISDRPIGEAMSKIADAFDAEWDKEGDALRLTRPDGMVYKEEQATIAVNLKELRKALDAKRKEIANLDAWDATKADLLANQVADVSKQLAGQDGNQQSWQRWQTLSDKLPGSRALKRIVALLDPVELAKMPSGSRVVFSNHPTAMQRPLPASVDEQLDRFQSEMQIWVDERNRVTPNEADGQVRFDVDVSIKSMTRATTVLVAVQRQSWQSGYGVDLSIADEKGKVLARANSSLDQPDYTDFGKLPPGAANETPLQIRPDSVLVSEFFLSRMGAPNGKGKNGRAGDDRARELVLDPEHHDPLSFASSDMLIGASAAKSVSLVAALGDEMVFLGAYGLAQTKATPSSALKLLQDLRIRCDIDGGWLTVKSRDPAYVRTRFVSRRILGTYLRAASSNAGATLDDKATYAANTLGEEYESLGPELGQILASDAGSRAPMMLDSSWDMVRIYGLMDSEQRRALLSNSKIEIASLTPKAIEVAVHMVYGGQSNLQFDYGGAANMGREVQAQSETFYSGINREPTVCLPDGIPHDAYLQADVSTRQVACTSSEQKGNFLFSGREMGVSEIAWQMFGTERSDLFPWMQDPSQTVKLDNLRFGSMTTINVTFHYLRLVKLDCQLNDTKIETGPPVPYDKLPQDFRDAVDKAIENLKKQYASAKPGQYASPPRQGNTIPPGA